MLSRSNFWRMNVRVCRFYSALSKLWLQDHIILVTLLLFDNSFGNQFAIIAVKTANQCFVWTNWLILFPQSKTMNLGNFHRRGTKLLANWLLMVVWVVHWLFNVLKGGENNFLETSLLHFAVSQCWTRGTSCDLSLGGLRPGEGPVLAATLIHLCLSWFSFLAISSDKHSQSGVFTMAFDSVWSIWCWGSSLLENRNFVCS